MIAPGPTLRIVELFHSADDAAPVTEDKLRSDLQNLFQKIRIACPFDSLFSQLSLDIVDDALTPVCQLSPQSAQGGANHVTMM